MKLLPSWCVLYAVDRVVKDATLFFSSPAPAPVSWTWMASACDTCGDLAYAPCCASSRQWRPTTQRPWAGCWLCEPHVSFLSSGRWSRHSLTRTRGASSWFMVGRTTWGLGAWWSLWRSSTYQTSWEGIVTWVKLSIWKYCCISVCLPALERVGSFFVLPCVQLLLTAYSRSCSEHL